MKAGTLSLIAFLMYVPIADARQPQNTPSDSATSNSLFTQPVTSSPQNRSPLEVHALIEENNSRPWWLGDIVVLLGIFVGAVMIIYQMGRQHKNELALQQENAREQLRLQIFQKISPMIEVATEKVIDAGTYASSIHSSISTYLQLLDDGFNSQPIKERASEFNRRYQEATNSLIKLIGLVEKYKVVSPQLDIFMLAIGVARHDMTIAGVRLCAFLIHILPMDIITPDGISQVINVRRPTKEQLHKLDELLGDYKKAEADIIGYLYDFNVEIQNIFLSKLFNNKVPRRKPLDPRIKVISTEPEEMEKLRKYFEEETDWGRGRMKNDVSS